MRGELVLLAVVACSSASPPPAPAPVVAPAPIAATVRAVSGDVRIQHHSTGVWEPLDAQAAIHPDDTVQALTGDATLRIAISDAELQLAPGTTMKFDDIAHARGLTGRFVARTGETTRLELALPPGTLVLEHRAEAAIEVADEGTTLEMRHGSGTIVPSSGPAIAVAEHETKRFDSDGTLAASPLPAVQLVAPVADAHLRVRKAVEFRWQPSAGAEKYRLAIDAGPLTRHLEVAGTSTTIAMATGTYAWTVQPLPAGPVTAPRALAVEVVDQPPVLAIETPSPGATVYGDEVRIAGRTAPNAIVEVSRMRATADREGRFSVTIPVEKGLSNLVIVARDDLGNQQRAARSVVVE